MENKKFEQLIELIINENEEQAKELFHDIVVEKSREIYENIMAEEAMEESMHDMEEGHPAGQVTDLIDEISAEETSEMSEAEDDIDAEFDDEAEEAGDEVTHDIEADHDKEGDAEDLEDRVVDIEDKLDMLMAKFEEEIMGLGGAEGDEEEVEVTGDEEMMAEASDEDDSVEEDVMEAVQLQKVSVTHGDDGANKKSVALTAPKVKAEGVKPVNFSAGGDLKQKDGPDKASNPYTKGQGDLIGDVGNSPGKKKGPELKAAPKPVTKDGASDKHSPVAKG
jgi:hypothetical protein